MPYFGTVADEDLSELQFHAVKMVGGTGKDFRVGKIDASADVPLVLGILQNKPKAGEAATVTHSSDVFVKAKVSEAVAAGAYLIADDSNDGMLKAASAKAAGEGRDIIARAAMNMIANEVGNVYLV